MGYNGLVGGESAGKPKDVNDSERQVYTVSGAGQQEIW